MKHKGREITSTRKIKNAKQKKYNVETLNNLKESVDKFFENEEMKRIQKKELEKRMIAFCDENSITEKNEFVYLGIKRWLNVE